MLENPPQSTAAAADSAPAVKRYAPPNQRNRSLNRRKSGDRSDRTNNLYGNDGEKNILATSRNIPIIDHGDVGSGNIQIENPRSRLIPLQGFSRSEAAQILNNRWRAAINSYNDTSVDLSERPVMYSGSGASAWGQFRLPHQIIPPVNSIGPLHPTQMDFLAELRRKMHGNSSFDN